jgi:hypothetical protein
MATDFISSQLSKKYVDQCSVWKYTEIRYIADRNSRGQMVRESQQPQKRATR